MYFLYSLLTFAAFVAVSPYFLYQAIRYKKYIGSLGPRLGHLPISFNVDGDESIWIHAVSVGEALTARALAADLKARYPRLRLFLSTTTIAGQQVARRSLQHVDEVFYFPFDWAFIVRRTLKLVKPRVFIMMETEIWPNLLRLCRQRGVKTVVINGRISSRSYPRYRLIRPFFKRVLADIDRFCMQSEESARRLIDLGAEPSRVTVTGSLKFDSLEVPAPTSHGKPRERVLRFFRISPGRMVIVAGSTLRGEEGAVLRAFGRVRTTMPNAMLVLAPRHPERFGEVERLARDAGFVTMRRSELPSRAPTSSCSTRSASWRSSISSPPPSSWAAASPTTAATIFSSRRFSGSRSSSGRTCRTSGRSPTPSWPTARRCRCSRSAISKTRCWRS
jgi:3-deoxy-D-manno-octulosonic-acid transferase